MAKPKTNKKQWGTGQRNLARTQGGPPEYFHPVTASAQDGNGTNERTPFSQDFKMGMEWNQNERTPFSQDFKMGMEWNKNERASFSFQDEVEKTKQNGNETEIKKQTKLK